MTVVDDLVKANMPANFVVQEYVDEIGFELPEGYEGTSENVHLAGIFKELIWNDEEWVLETKEPLPTSKLSVDEYVELLSRRFRLSDKEVSLIIVNYNMLLESLPEIEFYDAAQTYDLFLYFTNIRLIYRYECDVNPMGSGAGSTIFAALWQVWEKTFYPEILLPPELIRNVLTMFTFVYTVYENRQEGDFPENVLPYNYYTYDDAVYVAFQLNFEKIIDFWMEGIDCKQIRILLDSGVDSREALALGKRLPSAWIDALNMEPRKWQEFSDK